MGSRFLPRLVNGPFDDPALFVPFRHAKRALLFDVGDVGALSGRDILKISHIFVTHTHMDHFAGFDRVLRIFLGRDKDLYLYGPQGFLNHLAGKLAGYCWNLVQNYTSRLTLHATELHPDRMLSNRYPCRKGFAAAGEIAVRPFNGIALNEPDLTVRAVHLDHGTPVLGFAVEEPYHVNIDRDALSRLGFAPGSWLRRFKDLLYETIDPTEDTPLQATRIDGTTATVSLQTLTPSIARITAGQRLAYIADVVATPENIKKIAALADGADHLFVEAAFAHHHRDIARRKHHLTARQAGTLARICRVKRYSLFHHSPRYADCRATLEAEAHRAFNRKSSTCSV